MLFTLQYIKDKPYFGRLFHCFQISIDKRNYGRNQTRCTIEGAFT